MAGRESRFEERAAAADIDPHGVDPVADVDWVMHVTTSLPCRCGRRRRGLHMGNRQPDAGVARDGYQRVHARVWSYLRAEYTIRRVQDLGALTCAYAAAP